jgi:hypothetical protein
MQNSKFWRGAAIVICGSLLYVGHGLHGAGERDLPLIGVAHAGVIGATSTWNEVFTSSADGRILYYWSRDGAGMRYMGSATVQDKGVQSAAPIDGTHEPFWYDSRIPLRKPKPVVPQK